MSVSLPPPTEPSQANAAEIRAEAAVRSFSFQQFTVDVHGADVISDDLYTTIIEVSGNLSEVVRRLNAACYAVGYPACKTHFARVANTVYVLIDTRGLDRVEGNERLTPYFRGLEGEDVLSASRLEPRRFLANVHAGRAGIQAQPAIQEGDDGATVMDIASVSEGIASSVSAEFGNMGTRFVGRHLGSLSASIGSVWGDEITVGWREGFTNIGSSTTDGDYRELNAGISRVTPWGVFSIGARKVDYDFTFQNFLIDADIRIYDLGWLYPWVATFQQRFITQVKLDRNDSTIQTADGTPGELLDERYNSAELGLFYSRTDALWGRALQTDASLSYRQGLKDQVAVATGAELDYTYVRPILSAKYPIFERWELATTFAAQFSSDHMPQQQQWVLGGMDNLTAFLPGSAAGDEGSLARFTLSPPPTTYFGVTLKPSLLLEGGTVRFNDGANEVRLADVGARLDVTVREHLSLALAYATELADDNLTRDDTAANLYFSVRMRF